MAITKLPEAALRNPYATASREELDAALREVDIKLAATSAEDVAQRKKMEKKRKQIVEGYLWLMVREGKAEWSGGKPKGSRHPARITPGSPISAYIIEDRDQLRG
jgi:hypothetical protein